jgi:signal transduction histidine kinase
MILGMEAILLTVMLAYTIITVRGQASYLLNPARREAELILTLAERAIARAMTAGKSAEVQAILEEIGEVPDVTGIRIVDPDGTILLSAKWAEVGRVLGPRERPEEPVWDHRERTIGISRPILNRPVCHACHSPDVTTLGFLEVLLTLPRLEAEMARRWTFTALLAVLVVVAAGGLLAMYFTLVMGRRIDAIALAMRRIEGGDFAAKVPEGDGDELGRLGRTFNSMVSRLADAQRRLRDRHAEEIRRAEHLASLGQMAAGIAHEINNPLAGMQNCVRTLLKHDRDPNRRIQYLEMLQEGLGRIGRTVRQLLDFAREVRPQLTRTALAPLVHRCLALLEHELAARRISSAVSVDPALPPLVADPHQLEQVFLNILMNALQSMPAGGSLTVSAGRRESEAGSFVEVRIADTGGGIAPDTLPRIFDPFFTTKEVGEGTGLGLSVSYGIVQAHGGVIEVESEVGKGSTFTIALPVGGAGSSDASTDSSGRG